MNLEVAGGLLGVVIGLAGAGVGCYYAIRHTHGPKERRFMLKYTVVMAVLLSVLMCGVFVLGYPRASWLMLPFFVIVLPLLIKVGNSR